jgi:SlyX protein
MTEPVPVQERIITLESVVAYLEHTVEQLNSVILQQQQEIDGLKRSLQKLEGRVDAQAQGPEVCDPLQERPPHY